MRSGGTGYLPTGARFTLHPVGAFVTLLEVVEFYTGERVTTFQQFWLRQLSAFNRHDRGGAEFSPKLLHLCSAFAIGVFGISSSGASASTLFACTGGPNEQQVGLDTSNPSVPVPLCVSIPAAPEGGEVSQNGRRDITPYRPPGYKPPPRPKGWQKLWTGFSQFVVRVEGQEGSDEVPVYDYALAMNYPSEAEARAAAEGMCRLRGLYTRDIQNYNDSMETYCRGQTQVLEEPYVRIGVGRVGDFSVGHDVNPVRAANITRKFGDKSYNCSSGYVDEPGMCNYWVMAIIPNGRHERAPVTEFDHVFPCPNGPESDRYKVVGVDKQTGLYITLCGPDLANWE